jgi:tRNA1Val (adenine37-N6)-methyltransferase
MKVCTDSCLFGGWIANQIENKTILPKKILDIGAGTGLLSLMIAQKFRGTIDAVEIDENSFLEGKENFIQSKWEERLRIFHADIRMWKSNVNYDLIVSNPPFFDNDLKSANANKNIAKHSDACSLKELLDSIKIHLAPDGYFAVLLAFRRLSYFKTLAEENGFFLNKELLIRQTPAKSYFRGILFFTSEPAIVISEELTIKNERGDYTSEFFGLMKDYYLYL